MLRFVFSKIILLIERITIDALVSPIVSILVPNLDCPSFAGRDIFSVCLGCHTKYQKLGGLKKTFSFSQFWRLKVQDQDIDMVSFW